MELPVHQVRGTAESWCARSRVGTKLWLRVIVCSLVFLCTKGEVITASPLLLPPACQVSSAGWCSGVTRLASHSSCSCATSGEDTLLSALWPTIQVADAGEVGGNLHALNPLHSHITHVTIWPRMRKELRLMEQINAILEALPTKHALRNRRPALHEILKVSFI